MPAVSTRTQQSHVYYCAGRRVRIPPTADIEPGFGPGERYSQFVEEVLSKITALPTREEHRTISGFPELELRVVPSRRRRIVWAKHAQHTARRVQHSPFAYVRADERTTDTITIHLVMKDGTPWLVRAYAGEMRPPLPWMQSARSWYMGGVAGCRDFWRQHAFVYDVAVIVPRSERDAPPAPTTRHSRRRR